MIQQDCPGIVIPSAVEPGDSIAIVSPAGIVKEEFIDGAVAYLTACGFHPVVMPSAKGPAEGSYSATLQARLSDLRLAIQNPQIKAILCSRGGYGCIHLLPHLSPRLIAANPKWLIGFSDVSALHALWLHSGVASIHGPMAKHLSTGGADDPYSAALVEMLRNTGRFDISVSAHQFNRDGNAAGELRGGNLAVLNSLADTPYDIFCFDDGEDIVLFLEDIGERIYEVERMITRLILSGAIYRLRGLVIGQFTEYGPDRNFDKMEQMIDSLLRKAGLRDIPVAFNFPTGHVDDNYPLTEGRRVSLEVRDAYTRLRTIG